MNQAKKEKADQHYELIVENIDLILEFLGVTKKGKSLREEIEEGAKALYDHYHKATGKRKTDWEQVKKEYAKLTKAERERAYLAIEMWAMVNVGKEENFIKKCWTYLRDKNFNDELRYEQKPQQHFR